MDNKEPVREMTEEVKKMVNGLFENFYKPRIENHLDTLMGELVEQIIEKKIEKRFAFAIELLRSMNEQAMQPKILWRGQGKTEEGSNGAR